MENPVLKFIYCKSAGQIKTYLPEGANIVVIIDSAIQDMYGNFFPYPQISLDATESNKTIKTIEQIALRLLDLGADRSTFILAVGGGITSDISGLVASLYMRGVPFGYVPTTLLAQVDAAIGGKTAVNVSGYKNILGTINQPQFTIFCPDFLKSLPEKELKEGTAELLKTFILADSDSYDEAIRTIAEQGFDCIQLWPFIQKASKIKASIVEADPYEKGERKILNLGHTFAHALEKNVKISHGEAVSIGIILAARLSVSLGVLSLREREKLESDFRLIGLPTVSPVPPVSLVKSIIHDKKKTQDNISFIVIEKIGKACIYQLGINKLEEYLNDLS